MARRRRHRAAARAQAPRPRPGQDTAPAPPRWATWPIAAAVAILTAVAFLPALQNGFVWDDIRNFVENPHYRGLGASQVRWMFTTTHLGHYIPFTWLTLGADYVVWQGTPWGYHLTNLALHALTAAVACRLAMRLLGAARGRDPAGARDRLGAIALPAGAATAALLFAVHPLRVESVAWVTERRDVLSGLLFVLAVTAWLRYAAGRRAAYWLALACFAAATLCKAIVVTLPALLLVLDVYPLRRLGDRPGRWPAWRRLLVEKVPFLIVAAAGSGAALFAARRGALVVPLGELGVMDRLAVTGAGVALYAGKLLVPVGLAPFYPIPQPVSVLWPRALLGAVLATGVTVAAVLVRRRCPAILAAWACFLIALAPVSGILQNGEQLAADRYTYLPSLAVAILAGGAVTEAWRRWAGARRIALIVVVASSLAALGTLTWWQAAVWRDGETLWTHALANAESATAHYNLGVERGAAGRWAEAAAHYARAVEMAPGDQRAQYNLGVALAARGLWDEAVVHYRRALEIAPAFEAHANLGVALARLGRWDQARAEYRRALALRPGDAQIRVNLGVTLARERRWDEAIEWYRQAAQAQPGLLAAHYNWATALAQLGRWEDAAAQYREVIRLDSGQIEAYRNLGLALAAQHRLDEAIEAFQAALRIDPSHPATRANLEWARGLQAAGSRR